MTRLIERFFHAYLTKIETMKVTRLAVCFLVRASLSWEIARMNILILRESSKREVISRRFTQHYFRTYRIIHWSTWMMCRNSSIIRSQKLCKLPRKQTLRWTISMTRNHHLTFSLKYSNFKSIYKIILKFWSLKSTTQLVIWMKKSLKQLS